MSNKTLKPETRVPKVGEKEFVALMAVLMSIVAISIDAMLPALGIMGADLNVEYENQPQYIISVIFGGMAIGQLISGPLSVVKKYFFTA